MLRKGKATYVVNGSVVQILRGDSLLDDLIEDLLPEVRGGDILGVLARDDDGINTLGDEGTAVVLVLDGDLGLGIGTQPREGAITPGLGHGRVELVRQQKSKGEKLGGLIGGIAEHDTLITGTELFEGLLVVQTLSNIRRLLLNGNEDVAGLVVEALVRAVIADIPDGVTDDLLVVKASMGSDLAKDHDHT